MDPYNNFNEKLAVFMAVLVEKVPSRKDDIEKMRNICALVVSTLGNKLPSVWFNKNISMPLRDCIMKKDEAMFVKITGELEEQHKNEGKHEVDFSISEILHVELSKANEETKQHIWLHLKGLILCCDKCPYDINLEKMC